MYHASSGDFLVVKLILEVLQFHEMCISGTGISCILDYLFCLSLSHKMDTFCLDIRKLALHALNGFLCPILGM
jgi:hypothetical protein